MTGASGQDGSYLLERLLAKGYAVHGLVRPTPAVSVLPAGVQVHAVDLADHDTLHGIVTRVQPTEVFHLGGLSSVAASWADPVGAARATGVSAIVLLQAALDVQECTGRAVRFVQASSAEIFGEPAGSPQDESTPIRPVSPYGAAKAYAHLSVGAYRARGLHASSLILYNHESPRRPPGFVTRKITQGVARIARDGHGSLTLGNLEARRDWGWAPDYVDAMIRAAHGPAEDFVIATGHAHSVSDFVAAAFRHVGIDHWEGRVRVDPSLLRPTDPSLLVGDARRAHEQLGWRPTVGFEDIVATMVEHDVARITED